MSLYSSFAHNRHFDELDSPLVTAEGVKTPAQRRALALANLFVAGDTNAIAGTFSSLTVTALTSTTVTAAKLLTGTTVGTAGTGSVAEEHGDGVFHRTKLTCTALAVGTGDDDVDKAIGVLVYTFPDGAIAIHGGSVEGLFDQASHGITTDGEVGLGTVVASGAVSVLSGTATFEDVMTGQPYTNITFGTTRFTGAGTPEVNGNKTVIAAGASPRTVFLNLGADWPNIAAAEACTFTGTITIEWSIIN